MDLKILVNGNPIRKYFDREGRVWVESKEGSRFDLKVSNDTSARKLAVISVDGLNIIDGKHEAPETARGYILNSYSSITIPGWKTGPNSVREFYFTTSENSYSKKIGADERNIGVMGVVFFEEKYAYNWSVSSYPPSPFVWYTASSSTTDTYTVRDMDSTIKVMSCNNVSYQEPERKMAVGSGASVEYRTNKVNFDRGSIASTIILYYDSWEGLKRRGILTEDKDYRTYPQAFPNGEWCPNI